MIFIYLHLSISFAVSPLSLSPFLRSLSSRLQKNIGFDWLRIFCSHSWVPKDCDAAARIVQPNPFESGSSCRIKRKFMIQILDLTETLKMILLLFTGCHRILFSSQFILSFILIGTYLSISPVTFGKSVSQFFHFPTIGSSPDHSFRLILFIPPIPN